MPDAFEFPRMLRAIVPLMRARRAVVVKVFPYCFPGQPAVVGTLDELPKPACRLRDIYPVRIDRRTLGMVNFPARKMGTAHVPIVARPVGGENKSALTCANE